MGLPRPASARRRSSLGALALIVLGWPLLLLERVADEVAGRERMRERVKAGLFSMEVSGQRQAELARRFTERGETHLSRVRRRPVV